MNQIEADLVVKWYIEMEDRLSKILKTTLYTTETENIFLPPIANTLLDACSLLDAVFREKHIGPINRRDLTIVEYSEHFEPLYGFEGQKTIIYQYPLLYIQPFNGWLSSSGSYQPLEWWKAYNKIKHDRILELKKATLKNTVQSLCALHQVISKCKTFINALIRQDHVFFWVMGKRFCQRSCILRQQ